MLAPVVLIGGLALAGGGYDLSARHIAGLGVWLLVVGLLALGTATRAAFGRPFYWAAGLIGGLALMSALSSLWSGSMELSVIEADRVLVYLSFFLAAFLIAQTDERRQRFAEGLTIAVTLVALLALGSRLLPHVIEVGNSLGAGPRLRYPLGYWNANGAIFGIAIALLLWTSRRSSWATLCWLSVAAMPAVLLALYFTYSRGGLLSLLVATGCLLALSRDRLWLLATVAIGVVGALPAVLAVQARRDLADNLATQATVDQGVTVLAILLAGTALALLLFAGLRLIERRESPLTGRAVELSQSPVLLKRLAIGAALLAIGVAIAVGGRAWDQFSSSDLQFPNQPESHFGQLSGAGRHDFYRVAVDAFGEEPVLGHGAGTYEFSWERLRSIDMPVHNAHSLYLDAFAELGLIGGCLVLALFGVLLWTGFAAWRAASGGERERNAVLFAVMLAFAIGTGLDWFWEIAGFGAVFFLAAGVVVSVEMRAARRRAGGAETGGAPLRAGGGRPGRRLDRGDRADRAAAGPTRTEVEPARGRGRRPRRRRQPRRHRPLDRALGGLPLRAAGPARAAAGRPADGERATDRGDRTRGPQLAALLPALQGRARSRQRRRGRGGSRSRPAAESARDLLPVRLELWMSEK